MMSFHLPSCRRRCKKPWLTVLKRWLFLFSLGFHYVDSWRIVYPWGANNEDQTRLTMSFLAPRGQLLCLFDIPTPVFGLPQVVIKLPICVARTNVILLWLDQHPRQRANSWRDSFNYYHGYIQFFPFFEKLTDGAFLHFLFFAPYRRYSRSIHSCPSGFLLLPIRSRCKLSRWEDCFFEVKRQDVSMHFICCII